ncbi:MAG: OmpH family outer membrane protein [Halanaerobiaceae bacterium]
MKKIFILFLIIISLVLFVGCSTSQPGKVALIDMATLTEESARAEQLEQELIDIGNRLEVEYNQLKEEQSDSENREELDKVSQEYQENKNRLESGLNQEIRTVLDELSGEENIEIVLFSDSIYYGGVDITDEVIVRLDEKYSDGGETSGGNSQ